MSPIFPCTNEMKAAKNQPNFYLLILHSSSSQLGFVIIFFSDRLTETFDSEIVRLEMNLIGGSVFRFWLLTEPLNCTSKIGLMYTLVYQF